MSQLTDNRSGMPAGMRHMRMEVAVKLEVTFKLIHSSNLPQAVDDVYDADLVCEKSPQNQAAQNCVEFTVYMLSLFVDTTLHASDPRHAAHEMIHDAGAMPLISQLMSPFFPVEVVINVSNTVAYLATHHPSQVGLRATGGIAALVRLLKFDVASEAQVAAANTLCKLVDNDIETHEVARMEGCTQLLVKLLEDREETVSSAARPTVVHMGGHVVNGLLARSSSGHLENIQHAARF
eukprot:gene9791-7680_t